MLNLFGCFGEVDQVNIDDLYDYIDGVVSGGLTESGERIVACWLISLCNQLVGELDLDERQALELARQRWVEGAPVGREYLELRERLGRTLQVSSPDARAAAHRMTWAAMQPNVELDGVAAEFVVGLAFDAGISPQRILDSFNSALAI